MSTTTALIADMVDAGVPVESILGPSVVGEVVIRLATGGTLRLNPGADGGSWFSEMRDFRRTIVGSGTMQPAKIVSYAVEWAAR